MNFLAAIHEVEKILAACPGVRVKPVAATPPFPKAKVILDSIPEVNYPSELLDIYTQMGDCKFDWNTTDGKTFGENFKYGSLHLMSPNEIKCDMAWMREIATEAMKEGWDNAPGYAALVRDWPHWMPVFSFDNGDRFCIDMRDETFPIVFLEHDVMDGGPNLHGLRIAPNPEALIDRWKQIFFVECDWSLITDISGIDLRRECLRPMLGTYGSVDLTSPGRREE